MVHEHVALDMQRVVEALYDLDAVDRLAVVAHRLLGDSTGGQARPAFTTPS